MTALAWLIPCALFLGLVGLAAFLWSLNSGQFEDLDGTAVLSLTTGPEQLAALAVKRFIDIVGALLGLLILGPVILAAAALASYLPARRAAAIDPVETLKAE